MAKIKVPSPVIDEAVKETARLEREKEKLKDKKRWEAYDKYLKYLARKHKIMTGNLNTTK